MLKIKMNNQEIDLPDNCSLECALIHYGLKEKVYAIAIDGRVVPRSQHRFCKLQAGNIVDIIVPMQGG